MDTAGWSGCKEEFREVKLLDWWCESRCGQDGMVVEGLDRDAIQRNDVSLH